MDSLMDDLKGDTIENIVEELVTKICLEEDKIELKQQQPTSSNKEEECLQVQVGEFLSDAISLALEDFVGEESARAKEAEALLGGCLDLVCTYPEGYKPRQPLYSCKTCSAQNGGQLAGVCYACCENCHEGHDLVELYTKRNFCCDCGNSKFGKSNKCKLYEEKDLLNQRNIYNDNFKGIFCVCKKPYPPEEEEEEGKNDDAFEDMVQCQICEDWFHPSHAISDVTERSKLDREREEEEDGGFCLVCSLCIQKLPWLIYYLNKTEENQQNCCKLEMLKTSSNGIKKENDGICFPINWRDQLCRCKDCKVLYEDSDCQYLLDVEDTIEFFEKQNREQMAAKINAQDDKNKKQKLAEDAQLQRELALKMRSGIEQMKRHCITFFAKRSADKRNSETAVITKEDVADCFHELMVKRQKLMEDEEEMEGKEFAWTG
ncbi:hypothetical protein ACQ4LE_008628 [Meloidogyne hapla]